MNSLERYFPWVVVAFAALFLAVMAIPPADPPDGPHMYEFGRLPVVDGGRVMPLETLARNNLMVISNHQDFVDENKDVQPAMRWLLDTMISGALSQDRPGNRHAVFRIENEEIVSLLGLQANDKLRYSIDEIEPKMQVLEERADRAHRKEARDQDLVDRKAIELAERLERAMKLESLNMPLLIPPEKEGDEWQTLQQALQAWPEFQTALDEEAKASDKDLLTRTIFRVQAAGEDRPAVTRPYTLMLDAYAHQDANLFNEQLAGYRQWLAQHRPQDVNSASFEAFYDHFEPFWYCGVLYAIIAVLTCLSWLVWSEPLRRAAFWTVALLLLVHTFALFARMYISGRPGVFVTNLYSSAVFIGWGGVILGLILERLYRLSIGNFVAAVIGALTMAIAHTLWGTGSGDTIGVMQAVLDTNFWLATHVSCVTLGYAATFVAGLLGIIFIALGTIGNLTNDLKKSLGQAIYGIVCFATFMSFVGTVLGGIWADQSWGRFWGWDPKENGALIIVLMNALILHARWGGMVKQRGMAVLAVLGNIVTAWSWFGINMLGIGLHSYGFMEGAVLWVILWSVFNGLVAFVGVLPLPGWENAPILQAIPVKPMAKPAPARRRREGPETAITRK